MSGPLDSFQTLLASKLPFGWTTLRVGWERGWVSTTELQTYASDRLVDCAETDLPNLLSLADAAPTNTWDVDRHLRRLAEAETETRDGALHTWDIILLKILLASMEEVPSSTSKMMNGLLEFTYFWAERDYPPGNPHIVQGQGNDITPSEYYTVETYRQILEAHRQWVAHEEAALRRR